MRDAASARPFRSSVAGYNADAKRYCDAYESLAFEHVHEVILDLLPKPPTHVLDVGAGSGPDAAALAEKGYRVVAVEPSEEMTKQGRMLHGNREIEWIDDALPELATIRERGKRYTLVLLSAVWMHVPLEDRAFAFASLMHCLDSDGLLVLTLRNGPPVPERSIFLVSKEVVYRLAEQHGLELVREADRADGFGRSDITWTTLVFRRNPKPSV